MKITARKKKLNFENLNLLLNRVLNSLILEILLSKHASIFTLEVDVLDNVSIWVCLKEIFCDKK